MLNKDSVIAKKLFHKGMLFSDVILCLSSPAFAANDDVELQELLGLDLEEITVSVASKREEKIEQAPNVVSVVTEEEIAAFGAQNLRDVLSRIPNVIVASSHFLPHNSISIRGKTITHHNNHTLILINGRPFRDSYSGGAHFLLLSSFPIGSIESIELIRGPGSVLYGSNAMAGVVNIRTKRPSKKGLENSITAGYGSFDTHSGELQSSYNNDDVHAEVNIRGTLTDQLDLLVGGNVENLDGYLGTDYSTHNSNGYVQLDYMPLDWLRMVGGMQINKPDSIDFNYNPRLSVVANLGNGWHLKTVYGEAFRVGNAIEHRLNIATLKGNANLEPEKIVTTEAQIYYAQVAVKSGITVFYSELSEQIRPTGSGPTIYNNEGESTYKGVEFEGKIRVSEQWKMNSSLVFQTSKDSSGIKNVSLLPNMQFKVGTVYHPIEGITIGVHDSYFGHPNERRNVNPSAPLTNADIDAYHLLIANMDVDVTQFINLTAESNFSLYFDNIFDEDINSIDLVSSCVNAMPNHSGRAIYGKMTVKF